MKRVLLLCVFVSLPCLLFAWDIDRYKNFLNKPVPENAERVLVTEFVRPLQSTPQYSFYEIFEIDNGLVIMAALKIEGVPSASRLFFSEMLDTMEALGEPLMSNRTGATWVDNGYVIMLVYTAQNDDSASAVLYVLELGNLGLLRGVLEG